MKQGVFFSDISFLYDEDRCEAEIKVIPGWRREKISRYKRAEDRARGVGAFLLLARALELSGVYVPQIEFEYDRNEKPGLKGYHDVHFNLSHSGDLVMCIISGSHCGCDVQKLHPFEEKISKRFFNIKEHEYLMSRAESERDMLFTRLWAMKESVIKANGKGMGMELSSFAIDPEKTTTDLADYYLKEYFPEGICDHSLAACAIGAPPPETAACIKLGS